MPAKLLPTFHAASFLRAKVSRRHSSHMFTWMQTCSQNLSDCPDASADLRLLKALAVVLLHLIGVNDLLLTTCRDPDNQSTKRYVTGDRCLTAFFSCYDLLHVHFSVFSILAHGIHLDVPAIVVPHHLVTPPSKPILIAYLKLKASMTRALVYSVPKTQALIGKTYPRRRSLHFFPEL